MSTVVTEEFFYDEEGRLIKKVVTTVTHSDTPSFPGPNPWYVGDAPYPIAPIIWSYQSSDTKGDYKLINSA